MQALLKSDKKIDARQSFYHQLPENIICFSHLRWDFVFQRPQQLLTRFSGKFRVFFIEEPVFDTDGETYYAYLERAEVQVIVPHLPRVNDPENTNALLKTLLNNFLKGKSMASYTFWYYTPMALDFSRKHQPELIVYDCMDELSAFKFAPQALKELEKELLQKADIVFTGGQSLYEAKKGQHSNIHPFPSSIDKQHFGSARKIRTTLNKEKIQDHYTLGFYGVIDERFDIDLIRGIADARPDWKIVLVGPIVKIDPAHLPAHENITYTGPKSYQELPAYLAEWDFALIPFLLNESTKFISPTKTPEYLAAGVPVVSTPIRDVVNPYGKYRMVKIAHDAEGFIMEIEDQLQFLEKESWLEKVDDFLSQNSWDNTCSQMLSLMNTTVANRSMSSIA
ncbi:glycosyltransferase involved in cell wall biosynthesis [Mucilaginibacter sp. UYP25]|uniref:glycosyltransferase n=1 Tax=unclassified Mucilaginibacter TaxID=2617802 RepID=UPI003395E08D